MGDSRGGGVRLSIVFSVRDLCKGHYYYSCTCRACFHHGRYFMCLGVDLAAWLNDLIQRCILVVQNFRCSLAGGCSLGGEAQ